MIGLTRTACGVIFEYAKWLVHDAMAVIPLVQLGFPPATFQLQHLMA